MTAGALYTASLGGSGGLFAAGLPIKLPQNKAGIIVERPPMAKATAPKTAFGRRSISVVDASSRLEWFEALPPELTRVAVGMAKSVSVEAVTVCPAGVSPARTAMAHAVGAVLRSQRPPGRSVVMCGMCPPLGQGRTAVPHEFSLINHQTGEQQDRIVWEIISWLDVPVWLAGLAERPVAA